MAEASQPSTPQKDAKAPRDRSPSFPFIPLQTAIERLVALEKYFGRHPVPVDKAGLAWEMKPKSSQADQTLAALRSFGLIEYQGVGLERKAVLSEDGRTYLRAQQQAVKQQILKRVALQPKVIRKFWGIWGADRPPEPVCLDELVLKNGFSDTGAASFLKVYDATISYASLVASDKIDQEARNGEEEDEAADATNEVLDDLQPPPSPPAPAGKGEVRLMDGERELTTGLLSKDASFRLIVSGNVGVKEIERLIKKLELDKEILAESTNEVTRQPARNLVSNPPSGPEPVRDPLGRKD